MPYKFETLKIPLPKEFDRRVKLTDEQREEIRVLYGKISQRKLASIYGVSRSLIKRIGDDEYNARQKFLFKLRQADGRYYDKEKQRVYTKTHRDYKKKILKQKHLYI